MVLAELAFTVDIGDHWDADTTGSNRLLVTLDLLLTFLNGLLACSDLLVFLLILFLLLLHLLLDLHLSPDSVTQFLILLLSELNHRLDLAINKLHHFSLLPPALLTTLWLNHHVKLCLALATVLVDETEPLGPLSDSIDGVLKPV